MLKVLKNYLFYTITLTPILCLPFYIWEKNKLLATLSGIISFLTATCICNMIQQKALKIKTSLKKIKIFYCATIVKMISFTIMGYISIVFFRKNSAFFVIGIIMAYLLQLYKLLALKHDQHT